MKRYIKNAITPITEESIAVQMRLLADPRTSPEKQDEILEHVAHLGELDDDDAEIDYDAAFNCIFGLVRFQRTSPELLRKIYKHHVGVADDVFLQNQNTPNDVLEDIAEHSEYFSIRVESDRILQKRGVK